MKSSKAPSRKSFLRYLPLRFEQWKYVSLKRGFFYRRAQKTKPDQMSSDERSWHFNAQHQNSKEGDEICCWWEQENDDHGVLLTTVNCINATISQPRAIIILPSVQKEKHALWSIKQLSTNLHPSLWLKIDGTIDYMCYTRGFTLGFILVLFKFGRFSY